VALTTARTRATISLLIVAAVWVIGSGCTFDRSPSEPSPEPGPQYEPTPEDLCGRLQVEEIASQHDLVVSPWYEPTSRHLAGSGFWYTSCGFST
jgi:hypothetical protein